MAPSVSVVVPSYDGAARVRRLLELLEDQTLPPARFEVIVVDDGSPAPLRDALAERGYPFSLRVLRQANLGAAAARHHGASQAQAPILVFVDDDMIVGEGFLAAHAAHHAGGSAQVVLGRMRGELTGWGLMERWHQVQLDRKASALAAGGTIRGNHLFSANVSMRREDYLAAGGFDASLRRGHDAELGLRLEKRGVRFVFSEDAWALHGMDPHPVSWWRSRAMLYGQVDRRISRKHPELAHASPWRWFRQMNPLVRPFMHLGLVAPSVAGWLGGRLLDLAHALDAVRLRRLALDAVTVAYTIDYVRGLRAEVGSTREAAREAAAFTAGVGA